MYKSGRRNVSFEDITHGRLDLAQLKTEANDYSKHKAHDKYLECSQCLHRARWTVEDEDDEDINDGNSTSGNEWYFEKDVQCNSSTNNLVSIS